MVKVVQEKRGYIKKYLNKINISRILKELSEGQSPIIKLTIFSKRYRFIDLKFKIVSRWMLDVSPDEIVSVKKFDELLDNY